MKRPSFKAPALLLCGALLLFLLVGCVGENSSNSTMANALSSATPTYSRPSDDAPPNFENTATEPFAEPSTEPSEPSTEPTEPAEPQGSKILVAVFSATGNTAPLAETVAELLGADVYVIVPAQPYTEADLAYYTGGRCDQEQADPDCRPAIDGQVENMAQYDTVVIGHPIWHGQAPRIISTFLESYDFSDKTLTTFCTSHSSPLGTSAENLHRLVPEDVTWLESRRFPAGASETELAAWLTEIGLLKESTEEPKEEPMIQLTIAGTPVEVAWVENSTVDALKELLARIGPITLDMSDYAGFEKGAPLPETLPENNEPMNTDAGDIILYQGRQFVIYYDQNSWSLTPLGKITNLSKAELQELLGAGNVTVVLSLSDQ